MIGALYRPDRMALPNRYAHPIRPRDLWSDDPADDNYNQMVQLPHAHSHEVLRRPDPLYDLVLLTDFNCFDPVPGNGSAIFIHRWRRPGYPTAGCIGLRPRDLNWIAKRVELGARLIVR